MGYKKICLECKLTFNRPIDFSSEQTYPCPECAKPMTLLPHRFRPPKKSEDKKWETVKLLIENGFCYQHIYKNIEPKNGIVTNENYVDYPESLRDAKEFIEKYKKQALK